MLSNQVSATETESRVPAQRSASIQSPSLAAAGRLKAAPLPGNGVLVHEWISRSGGSEKVLEALAQVFPSTDVLCLWNESTELLPGRRIQETALGRSVLRRSKMAALPAMPVVWRRQHGHQYDWALISSHLFAHHLRFVDARPDFRKFVYVHTPARYIWSPELDGRGNQWWGRAVAAPLRRLDRKRATESVAFAANSQFVRDRIERAWGRQAHVVHPPVEVARIAAQRDWRSQLDPGELAVLDGLPAEFVLGASRLVPYKKLDEVIGLAEANGVPAVLAGSGPDRARLTEIAAAAKVPVHFLGRVSDELLYALYQRALCLVFPAIEDFGIMPVEAMAAGARVIGRDIGGTAETVVPGRTGHLFDFASPTEARSALSAVTAMDPADAVARAFDFDVPVFRRALTQWLRSAAQDGRS